MLVAKNEEMFLEYFRI